MKTIIFDFDGTIADSFDEIIKMAYRLTGHPKLKDKAVLSKLRNSSLMHIAKQLGVSKYKLAYLFLKGRRLINKHMNKIKPYPGVGSALKELNSMGYDLHLLSSNNRSNIEKFLKVNSFSDYFSKVHTGIGLYGKTKKLKKILLADQIKPEDCLCIANEPADIKAAKANGIKCIAVSWGYNDQSQVLKANPLTVINKPSELVNVIKGWDK